MLVFWLKNEASVLPFGQNLPTSQKVYLGWEGGGHDKDFYFALVRFVSLS
jgi:hypothetical protein